MSRNPAFVALLILTAINALNFFDRQILPAVQERMRNEEASWELTDVALGWLGTAFILLYAVVGLPLGRLADVWSRWKLLAAGVGLWSLMTAGSGIAWSYASLFLMRLGVGIGEAACAPVASSLIGDLYPAEKRARAMSFFMLGLPVGLALSFMVSSVIAEWIGWRAAFFVAGAPGLVLAFVALRIKDSRTPSPPTPFAQPQGGEGSKSSFQPAPVDQHKVSEGRQSSTAAIMQILALPTMWWLILSGALHNFNMYALGTFISSFLKRYHGLELGEAGAMSGLIYGMGAVGIFVAGWLGDRAFRRGVRWRLHVAWLAALLTIPCMLLALAVPANQPWMCAGWLLPAHFLLYFYYGTVYASIQDIIGPSLRGMAMAVYFCGMYLLGAIWGPAGTGFLSDYLARRAAAADGISVVEEVHAAIGLHDALYVVPLLSVGLAIVLMAAAATIKRDHEKQQMP